MAAEALAGLAAKLRCPACRGALEPGAGGWRCPSCARGFPVKDGVTYFHEKRLEDFERESDRNSDDLIAALKLRIKRHPALFSLFYLATGAFVGVKADDAVRGLPPGSLVINVGSGSKFVGANVVNLDYYAFPDVHIVADATKLPFQDGSVDAVVCESLLEHAEDPEAIAREIARVVRPGGMAYILVPFMLGYHSAPSDYRRWTMSGLRGLFADFEETRGGTAFGPTVTLNHALSSWLALGLSFGSAKIYQLLAAAIMALLSPLSQLDRLLALHPNADDVAYAIYFLGRRKVSAGSGRS